MPEAVDVPRRAELLTFEEIERFVRVAAPLGIDKIRLTGGEPLVRRDLPTLVEMLAAIPGIEDIGLTTNGILLAPMAQAALRRRAAADQRQPRHARPGAVPRADPPRRASSRCIEGILAAKAAGFDPVKVNAVAIRGITEDDVVPLGPVRPRARPGAAVHRVHADRRRNLWERGKVLFAAEILDLLAAGIGPLAPAPDYDPRAPAIDYDYADGGGRVGLIASVSRPFCMSCNRVRLTADGKLRNCLFALDETDVRAPAPRRRARRRDRPGDPRERRRQVGRARDQHRAVHQAGAADARDRRLTGRPGRPRRDGRHRNDHDCCNRPASTDSNSGWMPVWPGVRSRIAPTFGLPTPPLTVTRPPIAGFRSCRS